jgi:hypothetical protein
MFVISAGEVEICTALGLHTKNLVYLNNRRKRRHNMSYDKDEIKRLVVQTIMRLETSGLTYEEGIIVLKTALEVLDKIGTQFNDVEAANNFLDFYIDTLIKEVA